MSAVLSRITIFPIKSLDGVDVEGAAVLATGALENDRRFALVDADGKYVNGKRTAAVHHIRAKYNLEHMTVRFNDTAHSNNPVEFSLLDEVVQAGEWLSNAVGITCRLTENATTGFPDDTDSPGPTLISTATLGEVAGWFPDLSLDETRPRFRANLEIDRFESAEPVEPFWEDRLIGPAGTAIPFHIGDVRWLGMNPCQRCVVPTRDAVTAATISGFQKAFAHNREQHLPPWAPRERFNHFYRLAVNTKLASGQSPAHLHRGDTISIEAL
jgi:uncharacterized protein YcbX